MQESPYRGKTVFVTGNSGFKGSWLSLWLKTLGARVVGYSLDPPSEPSLFEVLQLAKDLVHFRGDVRDFDRLSRCMAEAKPDFVFHLAAQPLVRRSYDDPRLTYETNIMGTVNLLEAVRRSEAVRVVVNVTSDKCYENREWVWGYREGDPLGGRDPYSSSKGCAELVAAAYQRSFFGSEGGRRAGPVSLGSARAGNVIGGGDWGADRLVPDCVRALSQGERIRLRCPQAVRPWQHVLEPLSGYLILGAKLWEHGGQYAGAWNFGPSDAECWTVERVVEKVCRLWGSGDFLAESGPQPHEATWLALDCSKARRLLGWNPKLTTEAALAKTVLWYKEFYSGCGAGELKQLMTQQIEEHDSHADAAGLVTGAESR